IVLWLGVSSPHLSSSLRELADLLPEKTIVGVFEQPLRKERLELGWHEPSLGRVEVVMSPDLSRIEEIALRDPANTVHIFGGLRLPLINRAIRICAPTAALIGVLSEARDWRGWAGKFGLLHSYVIERPRRNRVDFLLAIGHMGVRWYEMCGYPSERIFSWGYFVENEKCESIQRCQENRGHNITIAF